MELPSSSEIEVAMSVTPVKKPGNRFEYVLPLDTPWLAQFQSLSEMPLRFASILVALKGTENQDEHQDDPTELGERVIVYLTDVKTADDGALEIAGVPQLGDRGKINRYTTRDMHRGLANKSDTPRIALGLAYSHSTKAILTIGGPSIFFMNLTPTLKVGPNTLEDNHAGLLCELAFRDGDYFAPNFYSLWDTYSTVIFPNAPLNIFPTIAAAIEGGAYVEYNVLAETRLSISVNIDNRFNGEFGSPNFSVSTSFGSDNKLTFTFAALPEGNDYSRTVYSLGTFEESYFGIPQNGDETTWIPAAGGALTTSALPFLTLTRPTNLHVQLVDVDTQESFYSSIPQNASVEDGCNFLVAYGDLDNSNLRSVLFGEIDVDVSTNSSTSAANNDAQKISLIVLGFFSLVMGILLMFLIKGNKAGALFLTLLGIASIIIGFTVTSGGGTCESNGIEDIQTGIWENGSLVYNNIMMPFANRMARHFAPRSSHVKAPLVGLNVGSQTR